MSPPRASDDDRTQLILQPGAHVFGRYVLAEIVGEGGMGVVWRAHDEKLERDVALKFLPDRVRRDPEAIRDLKRETRRCLDLTHPNIVRVYDFVEDNLAAAIAMEYVQGKSLSALKVARPGGCFDVADLVPLVPQLCAALDYAHVQAKVVHRDLKPANLLVTTDGVLKIADFGIARSLRETDTRQTADPRGASGTLAFMGPQQLESKGKPTPTDDLYALGATLYDLLTGKPPFYGADMFTEIRMAIPAPLMERRAELENTGAPIPPGWERTILACLAKRAEDRPTSAAAVLAMIDGGAAPSAKTVRIPAAATEPNAEERGQVDRAPASRRWWWLGLAGTAVLAALAAVFWPKGAAPSVHAPTTVAAPPRIIEDQKPKSETPPPPPVVFTPAPLASADSIEAGMPESRLLQFKGQPDSKISAGAKSIYNWSDLSVTMKDGRVESFKVIDVQKKRADEAARAKADMARKQGQATVTKSRKKSLTPSPTNVSAGHDLVEKSLIDGIAKKQRIAALENSIKAMESQLDANLRPSKNFKIGHSGMSADEEALLRLRLDKARRDLAELK